MSGNGHGGSRTLAEKRFPSTVRKSNITRRRAVRSPFRWSFFNPAIDVKLFKSRFPLNCRGFRFDRTSLQIFEITPRFMHDFPFSLSLSLSLFLSLVDIKPGSYRPEIRLYFRRILSSKRRHHLIEVSIRLHCLPSTAPVRYFPRLNFLGLGVRVRKADTKLREFN